MSDQHDEPLYRVVVNLEEQYSIWIRDRDIPAGWRDEGFSGTRAECLAHIDQVWTDLLPLSARQGPPRRAAARTTQPTGGATAPPRRARRPRKTT